MTLTVLRWQSESWHDESVKGDLKRKRSANNTGKGSGHMFFTQWLRNNRYAAAILTIARIYVGWEFLHAGWEKLTSAGGFSALGFLQYSAQNPVLSPEKAVEYPWFNSFFDRIRDSAHWTL